MKILIVTGRSNDVFIYNFAKWLKRSIDDVTVDVVGFDSSDEQGFGAEYFDSKYVVTPDMLAFRDRHIRPFLMNRRLMQWLDGRYYDIIQCHWLVPQTVVSTRLKDHCRKLCATFWGGELETLKVLKSHRLYLHFLERFLKNVDHVLNSEDFNRRITARFPFLSGKVRTASLGSAAMDELYSLMKHESKAMSKEMLGIDRNKVVVMIGYSGKEIHQHIPIVKAYADAGRMKDRIHLLAPMTRGAKSEYNAEVEKCLSDSGYSYTLLKDRFLTDIEIARLRNATDIVLQMSVYDGFSRSIVECLCAGAIMIYGSWLDYGRHLASNGFTATASDGIPEAVELSFRAAENLDSYSVETESNRNNGCKRHLWEYCINGFVSVYNEIWLKQ